MNARGGAGAERGERRVAGAGRRAAAQHHHRPRPAAVHRQHLAGRSCAARMVAMTPQGEIRALYSAPSLRPEPLRRRHLGRATTGTCSPTRPTRSSIARSTDAIHRRRPSSSRPRRWRCGAASSASIRHMPVAVQRRLPAGQPRLQVLEEGRARLARPDRRRGEELRRVLLPAGPAPRARRDHPGRRPDGLPRPERRRPAERAGADLPGGPAYFDSATGRATGARRPPSSTSRSGRARTPRP